MIYKEEKELLDYIRKLQKAIKDEQNPKIKKTLREILKTKIKQLEELTKTIHGEK